MTRAPFLPLVAGFLLASALLTGALLSAPAAATTVTIP